MKHSLIRIFIIYWVFAYLMLSHAAAQISTDGTIGDRQLRTLQGPDYNIESYFGEQKGGNLFHSFKEFNINTGESAAFKGPDSVQNIISRVTGGSHSWIDGALKSDIHGANLFLLNPRGVMFGPDASLDLSGSFHVSTADYLKLGNDGRFDAASPEKSILTSAPPSAFGFLDDAIAGISFDGCFLSLSEGENLSVTGGELEIKNAQLHAPGGNLSIAAVGSQGETGIQDAEIHADGFETFSSVRMTQTVEFPKINEKSIGNLDASGYTKGGKIYIRGGNLIMDGGMVKNNNRGNQDGGSLDIDLKGNLNISDNGGIYFGTTESGDLDKISTIKAENIELSGDAQISSTVWGSGEGADLNIIVQDSINIAGRGEYPSGMLTATNGTGKAGNLTVTAKSVKVSDEAVIYSDTSADPGGKGGNITLNTDTVELIDGADIAARTKGSGNSGDISITANRSISVAGLGSSIETIVGRTGDSGRITINTPELVLRNGGKIDTSSIGEGDAGDIEIRVNTLDMIGGGQVQKDLCRISAQGISIGRAGNITIDAAEYIIMDGNMGYPNSINVSSLNGECGDIRIRTPLLEIRDSGNILSTSFEGHAGNIDLAVGTLRIDGGFIDSSCYGFGTDDLIQQMEDSGIVVQEPVDGGKAGNINIHATDSILLVGKQNITEIETDEPVLKTGHVSTVQSSSGYGKGIGGTIHITTPNLMIGKGGIVSTATYSEGQAGEIEVHAQRIEIKDEGAIMALTGGQGDAGDVRLFADQSVTIDKGGVSTSSYGSGNGSTTFITTPELTLSNGGIIEAVAKGQGKGGMIDLSVETLNLFSDAKLNASATDKGDSGKINISASDIFIENGKIGAVTTGEGKAGDINIDTENLKLTKNGNINSATKGLSENATGGNIGIISSNGIHIEESSFIATGTTGQIADAGDITISTPYLKITTDGYISAQAYNKGKGNAGDMNLYIGTIDMNRGSVLSSTDGVGTGGIISIIADNINLNNESYIHCDSFNDNNYIATGNAGDVNIHANNLSMNDSLIATAAANADGGNISILTGNLLSVKDGGITTSVESGEGAGGNITISNPKVIALNNSKIIANTYGGPGGNIRISVDNFIRSAKSTVQASSQLGIDGTVHIETPDNTDIVSGISVLPGNFTDAGQWLPTRCEDRAGEPQSAFVLKPRDAVPASPDDWQPSLPAAFPHPDCQALHRSGAFEKTAAFCENMLKTLTPEDDPKTYSDAVLVLADAYKILGYQFRALSLLCFSEQCRTDFKDALRGQPETASALSRLFEQFPDEARKALFLAGISDIALTLGNIRLAESYAEQAETAAQASRNPKALASVLNTFGNVYSVKAESAETDRLYNAAMNAYEESLVVIDQIREGSQDELKVRILLNIARLSQIKEKDLDKADRLKHALTHIKGLPDSHVKAWGLLSLSQIARKIRLSDAEFTVDAVRLARHIAETQNDTRTTAYACGYAGQIYQELNRRSEAAENIRQGVFLAETSPYPEIRFFMYRQAGRVYRDQGEPVRALKAYGEAARLLNPGCAGGETDDASPCKPETTGIIHEVFNGGHRNKHFFDETIRSTYLEQIGLISEQAEQETDELKAKEHLTEIVGIIERMRTAELRNFFQDECVGAAQNTGKAGYEHIPNRTAALYPILLPEQPIVLLVTSGGVKQFRTPVNADQIRKTAEKFAESLRKKQDLSRIRQDGYRLYTWLIRPLEAELAAQETDTLVIVPDGVLRLIPFAALFNQDKNRYLIEEYAMAVSPGMTLTVVTPEKPEHAPALLGGLSESRQDFEPLPYVQDELHNISRFIDGKILLNHDYQKDQLSEEFKAREYPHIVMSTHGVFGSTHQDTYLLTYDDKMSMSDLNDLIRIGRYRKNPVELLTLSACETALGDERAALGLGGVAVRAGAKSAIATLWKVNDESTAKLISDFYRQLSLPENSKAKSLQLAQKELITSENFHHPFYWAPFLLIGDWL